MATYTATRAGAKPEHHTWIVPSAWASDWPERRTEPLRVGLVSVSQLDVETARAEGAKRAWELHPTPADVANRADAFRDAVMVWIVARGTCDPEDSRHPWIEAPEENLRAALTPEGIRALYDAWAVFRARTSPIASEVSDADLASLLALLEGGVLGCLGSQREGEVRRLLGAVYDEVTTATTAREGAAGG